jgi:hypothetical protein
MRNDIRRTAHGQSYKITTVPYELLTLIREPLAVSRPPLIVLFASNIIVS